MGASAPEWFKVGLDFFILPAVWFVRGILKRLTTIENNLDKMPAELKLWTDEHFERKGEPQFPPRRMSRRA